MGMHKIRQRERTRSKNESECWTRQRLKVRAVLVSPKLLELNANSCNE